MALFLVSIVLVWAFPASAIEPIPLAVVAPLVGPSTIIGRQIQAGAAAAVALAGARGVLGRQISLTIEDDGCDTAQAGAVARKVAEAHPALIIGHTCSLATLAGAPIYAAAGVLEITPASTSPLVTEQGIPTLFRLIGRDDLQGRIAAEYLAQAAGRRKILILRQDNAYGRGLSEAVESRLRSLGHPPVGIIEFLPFAENYLSVVDRIKASGAELLYIVGGAQDAAMLIRQIRQLGLRPQIVSGDAAISSNFWQVAGEAAEGIRFTFPPKIIERAEYAGAFDAIRRNGGEIKGYALHAYAAVEVWLAGVTRAGSLDAAEVAAAIRREPIDTIIGKIWFDAKGDMQSERPAFVWYEWRRGQSVPLDR